jgi:hypothetical protein
MSNLLGTAVPARLSRRSADRLPATERQQHGDANIKAMTASATRFALFLLRQHPALPSRRTTATGVPSASRQDGCDRRKESGRTLLVFANSRSRRVGPLLLPSVCWEVTVEHTLPEYQLKARGDRAPVHQRRRVMRRMLARWNLSNVALAGLAGVVALVGAACGESALTAPTPVGSSIAIVSGDKQAGTIGAPLIDPLVVQVNDQAGRATPGVTVRWQVIDADGKVSPATTITDTNGRAQATWILHSTAGTSHVTAVIGALATQTAEFTAVAMLKQ